MRGAGRNHGQVDPIRNTTTAGGRVGWYPPLAIPYLTKIKGLPGGGRSFYTQRKFWKMGKTARASRGTDQDGGHDQGNRCGSRIPEPIRNGEPIRAERSRRGSERGKGENLHGSG